jgi:hypothetical protein
MKNIIELLLKLKQFLSKTFCPYVDIRGYSKEENCHNCNSWNGCTGMDCQWELKK